jgi:N6-L-threonylcarbamoyladenine synthase
MKILSIETSCDETAVAVLECDGDFTDPSFRVLGNALYSQIATHAEYGGVYPMLAKREHAKNLIPLLKQALIEADLLTAGEAQINQEELSKVLEREPELLNQFLEFIPTIKAPNIDAIAVTRGPGLEPALWVGVNFARALATVWGKPLVPVNHMEGHVLSPLATAGAEITNLWPALALLISGGHTQLVLAKNWGEYEIIGETRDDAVGEAFDKVARMLGLPYPGGPEISRLAAAHRTEHPDYEAKWHVPRPMLNTDNLDFSFSGLKTAIRYTLGDIPAMTDSIKKEIAREVEDAITEILITKTRRALLSHHVQSLIVGGGVIANTYLRAALQQVADEQGITLLLPETNLATDNALMIAIAGYFNYLVNKVIAPANLTASGNLRLE